jgi:hypothetical protein
MQRDYRRSAQFPACDAAVSQPEILERREIDVCSAAPAADLKRYARAVIRSFSRRLR